MPSSDEVIPAALALHYSPRRYALLLGSGISRDTGILTAGEITDDLIRQIAGEKIKSGQEPQDWYKETHGGRAPTFTSLFSEVAKSEEDRKAILRQYFELEGIEPTPAHMSIARLVRDGVISMIITTNFDPLLEEAIKKGTGKTPVVITHESDPRPMEVAGDQCRIVMANGRYPTTDLKLTPDDLASYDEKLTGYLDRIFSEYGLVICGWSGEHDTGLVEILIAERIRRFAIFWCNRESPEKILEVIRSNLHLSTIGITSANEFFGDLEAKIDILRRHERITSLTVEGAIKKVKDALRDPRPELILSDLLHGETDRVLAELNRSDIVPKGPIDGKTCFKNRLEEFERAAAPLAAMVATLAYYDDGAHADLITETIDRLINLQRIEVDFLYDGQRVQCIKPSDLRQYFHNLRLYPALLVIYASGITAVQKRNFNSLSAILEKPQIKRLNYTEMSWKTVPYFENVNIWFVLWTVEQWTIDFSLERFGRRENPHYYPTKIIQAIINNLIPNEMYFDTAFDIFEYLYGLSYLNLSLSGKEPSKNYPLSSRLVNQYLGPCFGNDMDDIPVKIPDPVRSYFSEIAPKIKDSKFFGGDLQKFERCNRKYTDFFNIEPVKTGISLPEDRMIV